MPNDKPAHEVRFGAIKAAIWKNDTGNGVRYNVSVRGTGTSEGGPGSDLMRVDEKLTSPQNFGSRYRNPFA